MLGPVALAIVALSVSSAAPPAAETSNESVRSAARREASLYHVSLGVDGPVIVAAALAGGIPYLLAPKLIHPTCPCSPTEVNRFDRHVIGNHSDLAGNFSDVGVVLFAAVPAALDLHRFGWSKTFLEDVTVLGESLLVNGAAVSLVKVAVQRPIPRVYSGTASATRPRNYRSFYSGHTSSAFATLATVAYTLDARYDAGAWPWLAMLAGGAGIAALRIVGGYHFYSDVLVGAAVGTGIGILVPALHRRRQSDGTSSWTLTPTADGLAVRATF